MKISIFSVVKNEEAMIEDSLKSMAGADEIVIIDTGSTDKTIEIAKKYTDKIYTDYKWKDNFAEAKNYAMSKCTGDWVMGLDADCRLEPNGVEKIKKMVESAKPDQNVFNVRVVPNTLDNRNDRYHILPKIFRNGAGIQYAGRVHEYVTHKDKKKTIAYGKGDVAIVYLYSPNHYADPNRNLRILLQEVKDHPDVSRWKFYLGREYFQHKEYIKAIWWLQEYLRVGKWEPEVADAYYVIAKAYWQLHKGQDARLMCSHAIRVNPDFRAALLLMAEMHYEPRKSQWNRFAELAKNNKTLFKM